MSGRGFYRQYSGMFRVSTGACVVVAITFLAGIASGAVGVKALAADQKSELLAYVDAFMRGIVRYTEPVSRGKVLHASLLNNARTAAATWFLGVTVIGIPVTILILFTRGFVLGFTVGFLVEELGYKGVAFSAAAILPHNLLAVPALLCLGIASLSFSFGLIASKRAGIGVDFLGEFWRYTVIALILTLVLLISSGIEGLVTPAVLGVIAPRMV
ncbi:MAG: stage II sporulation protein M [Ignavibacteriales bacterium]